MMRMTLGRGLDGSNTSYSSISSAVSDKSESLSMENWWMGGRRSYLSGNTERRRLQKSLMHILLRCTWTLIATSLAWCNWHKNLNNTMNLQKPAEYGRNFLHTKLLLRSVTYHFNFGQSKDLVKNRLRPACDGYFFFLLQCVTLYHYSPEIKNSGPHCLLSQKFATSSGGQISLRKLQPEAHETISSLSNISNWDGLFALQSKLSREKHSFIFLFAQPTAKCINRYKDTQQPIHCQSTMYVCGIPAMLCVFPILGLVLPGSTWKFTVLLLEPVKGKAIMLTHNQCYKYTPKPWYC